MEKMKLKRKIGEIFGVDVILEVEEKDIMLDYNALEEKNIMLDAVEYLIKDKIKIKGVKYE